MSCPEINTLQAAGRMARSGRRSSRFHRAARWRSDAKHFPDLNESRHENRHCHQRFCRSQQSRRVDLDKEQVLLTDETDPAVVITRILAGEALPETRFDITTTLCKLRDLFSRH